MNFPPYLDAGDEYLARVLGELCLITLYADCMPLSSTVELLGPGVFRITLDPPYTLIVDVRRRIVDDPEGLLHGFPGRLSLVRDYRLVWRDKQGIPASATVAASSRRFARLFAGAPENAYVERI